MDTTTIPARKKQEDELFNYEPTLHSEHTSKIEPYLTVHKLINGYNGLIENECLRLLVDDWDAAGEDGRLDLMKGVGWEVTIKVFSEFKDMFNVHKFCMGFKLDVPQRFRQATIVELLALGIEDPVLGLRDVHDVTFTYCLGSALVGGPVMKIACGMVQPMIFYPGLESMDGSRQMLSRDINAPWSRDTRIALVELKK